METDIKQIAERLKGLREDLELGTADCAQACEISRKIYENYETGETDIPVTFLIRFSSVFNIELTTLLTGEAPRMHSYSLTRKGQGTRVDRRKEYMYRALNEGFIHKKASPFIVTVEADSVDSPVPVYHHEGQEFNMVLEGRMMIMINGKELFLEEGDSLWFDSGLPHGMKALDGKQLSFLAIVF
jgi:mannose-6-phosphate isomerase-like protein (cupin superfamily)